MIAAILLLIYLFFAYVLELILPFAIAWAAAMMIQPAINVISKGTKMPKKVLSIIFVLSALAVIGTVLFLLAERLFTETQELLITANENADRIIGEISEFLKNISIGETIKGDYIAEIAGDMFKNALNTMSAKIPEWLSAIISALPEGIFFSVILVMASFYICADINNVNGFIMKYLPKRAAEFLREVKKHISAAGLKYLRAYILMFLLTFTQLLVGFVILGIDYAFTAALFTAFVDILPILGVGTVLIPWSTVTLLQGEYYTGFGLLIIFVIVWIIRQFAEPKILGVSIGLNPLVTLLAMYSGFKLFGFAGMLGMPALAIVAKSLLDSGAVKLRHDNA